MAWLHDALTALLLLLGVFFCFVAAVGVVRMPDTYLRMHAATKSGTLGCGLVLLAVAVHFAEIGVVSRAIVTIAFLFLTNPVGSHMMGRAAYRTGVPLWANTRVDEWRDATHSPGRDPST